MAVRAAVPLRAPVSAGYRLARQVTVVSARNPGRLTNGDVIRVTLTIDASADRNWVVVADPIPAGATIVGGDANQSTILAQSTDDTTRRAMSSAATTAGAASSRGCRRGITPSATCSA